MIAMKYEDWCPKVGAIISTINVDFDPAKYKSKSEAAQALHKELCKMAKKLGQDPKTEVFITSPQKSAEMGYGNCWRVSWEAGPYQWAIGTSFQVLNREAGWYTEPYYSFDLCFTE